MNTEINAIESNNAQAHINKADTLRPKNSITAFAALATQAKAIADSRPKPTQVGKASDRSHKISAAQIGVPKKPVSVKVGDKSYHTLCDALRAHGFNVQGDWIKARKLLKSGPAVMALNDAEVTFEIII